MKKSRQQHDADVERIRGQIQNLEGRHTLHCSGRGNKHQTNSLRRPKRAEPPDRIDFSVLSAVIDIDPVNCTALVEPGVTMEELATATIPLGLVPPVLPEFRGITVGGAIMGAGGESGAFRYGTVADTCRAYDLLLADGSLLHCSPEEYADLFFGVSGSYGTIARLALAEIQLVPAKPYVLLEYRLAHGVDEMLQLAREWHNNKSIDFVDGMVVEQNTFVMMAGRMVNRNEIPSEVSHLSLSTPWAKWFSQHVMMDITPSLDIGELTYRWLSLQDYLFRYDRAAFWMGQYFTDIRGVQLLPQLTILSPATIRNFYHQTESNLNPSIIRRTVLYPWMASQHLYATLHSMPTAAVTNTFFIQDFCMPASTIGKFLEIVYEQCKIFPLWILPSTATNRRQIFTPNIVPKGQEHHIPAIVNVGIYGIPKDDRDIPALTHEMEQEVQRLGGRKTLYAFSYYNKEEFWNIYDQETYRQLRKKYGAEEALPDIYDKVCEREY